MTLEEAKKILEKEFAVISLHKSTEPFEFDESGCIDHENPSVLEAFRVLSDGGYYISIIVHDYNMREKRLKKEYEENTMSPGPCEEQPKEGNPALKESASQFNDALLDEQGRKIKRLGKEISKLSIIIHDKNAVLSDVAEELRLSKIREKNLAESGLKYVVENEKLKKKLADKIVDEIDARALKSSESALAYKEKVIAEKDEVIADLCNELAATKKKLDEKAKLVEIVREGSKGYCEYGIAAGKMIRKMAKVIVRDKPVSLKDFKEYHRLANGYSFNPQLFDFSEEDEKKLSLFRDDSVGAVTNQEDCSPAKDTHPAEDKPAEVGLDEIPECVRKALEEEGHTVSIDYKD